MAIPAMITAMGQQSLNYGSAVGQQLQQLGQQVGQQLAMDSMQREAAATLPAIRQAMSEASNLIGNGEIAKGYALAFNSLPLASQNPFIQQTAQTYLKSMENLAEIKQKADYYNLQSGYQTAKKLAGGKPTYEVPSTEKLLSGEEVITGDAGTEYDAIDAAATAGLPAMQVSGTQPDLSKPLEDIPSNARFSAGMGGIDGAGFEAGAGFLSSSKLNIPQNPPAKDEVKAVQSFDSKTPEQQNKITESVVVKDYSPKNGEKLIDLSNIPGIPFKAIVGKNTQKVEVTETYSQKSGSTKQRKMQELNDFDLLSENAVTIGNVVSGNKKLMDLLNTAKGNWNNVQLSVDRDIDGNRIVKAYVNGVEFPQALTTADIKANEPIQNYGEAEMISFIKNLVPTAKNKNYKLIEQPAKQSQQPTENLTPQKSPTIEKIIPKEAAELQKIVEQGEAAKVGDRIKATEKRIKDIDEEIKRLSSIYIQGGGGGYFRGGYTQPSVTTQKTPEQARADIQKIAKLKSEKDALLGEDTKATTQAGFTIRKLQ